MKHHRDPNHLTKTLPWTFKDVYDDLGSSDVQLLQFSIDMNSTTSTPFAARGVVQNPSKNTSTKTSNNTSSLQSPTKGIHHTWDGCKFISHNNILSTAHRPTCLLCSNKHVNPWHPTENFPYKHPTQILPKDVRNHVMQHNALHGAEKKDYTRDQDIPTTNSTPPRAASAITTPEEQVVAQTQPSSASSHIKASLDALVLDDDEIIETEYFDLPLPPPTANLAFTANSNIFADLEPDTVITDPLQYLSYES